MNFAQPKTLTEEIIDFLVSNPTLEQLAEYKAPEALDNRLHELLDKNSEEGLTAEERSELDEFKRMRHFMNMLKAKAKLKLVKKTS
jgi:hypothetical protein